MFLKAKVHKFPEEVGGPGAAGWVTLGELQTHHPHVEQGRWHRAGVYEAEPEAECVLPRPVPVRKALVVVAGAVVPIGQERL